MLSVKEKNCHYLDLQGDCLDSRPIPPSRIIHNHSGYDLVLNIKEHSIFRFKGLSLAKLFKAIEKVMWETENEEEQVDEMEILLNVAELSVHILPLPSDLSSI